MQIEMISSSLSMLAFKTQLIEINQQFQWMQKRKKILVNSKIMGVNIIKKENRWELIHMIFQIRNWERLLPMEFTI